MKKMDNDSNEKYYRKCYVDNELICNVRDTYRAKFGMFGFAKNYKNKSYVNVASSVSSG